MALELAEWQGLPPLDSVLVLGLFIVRVTSNASKQSEKSEE
jgi:hypothetical protein